MVSPSRHIAAWLERRRTRNADPVRSTLLTVAGFGVISYGLYEWVPQVGIVAAGLSLLLIEALSKPEGR